MTFCSKEQDERKIITKVEHVNYSYTLHYLDGSDSYFYNNDKDFMKKIEERMIEQAKERNKIDSLNIAINKWGSLIVGFTGMCLASTSLKKNLLTIACLAFLLSTSLIYKYLKNSAKLKELKKYKLILENYKEFKDNPNISKLVEPDALYREPVNIFTADNYSLYDIKLMLKNLNNKKY